MNPELIQRIQFGDSIRRAQQPALSAVEWGVRPCANGTILNLGRTRIIHEAERRSALRFDDGIARALGDGHRLKL